MGSAILAEFDLGIPVAERNSALVLPLDVGDSRVHSKSAGEQCVAVAPPCLVFLWDS
jgi:hypothetical protein